MNVAKFRSLILILIGLLPNNLALSQSVPPLMNYQGHLTNETGQPLPTGQYTLTFNVYNVPNGGAAVWGPQAITADVIDGYFNVVLSTDSTGGDSITTAFAAQPRYVSIRVDSGAEILPRQQVLSAPYAIQAGNAATANVASTTSGAQNVFPGSGSVGIGTTTPDRKLTVSGESRFDGNVGMSGALSVSTATVTGLLTAGSLQYGEQKTCRVGGSTWQDSFVVPNSWTITHCSNFRTTSGVITFWRVGCIFADGVHSEGSLGGGIPPRNCGW